MDTEWIPAVIYGFGLIGFGVLFAVSRHEEVTEDPGGEEEKLQALFLPFRRAARFLKKKKRYGAVPGAGAIQNDLMLLDPSKQVRQREQHYHLAKLGNLLFFLFLALLCAFLSCVSTLTAQVILDGRRILRSSYGGEAIELTADAQIEGEEKDASAGVYTFRVEPREYTQEQCEKLAEQAFAVLEGRIAADNPDFDHVRSPLDLPDRLEGFPFRIRWKSSSEYLGTDGSVHTESFQENERERAELTAILTVGTFRSERGYLLCLYPPAYTEEEKRERALSQELLEKEAATRQSGEFVLPDQFGGLSLRWKEKKSDSSVLLLIGIAAAGFLSYALSDYELHKKVENRGREMKIDYPTLVSKFVLFLGAGLSVRNVFRKLGEDYLKQRGEGGEKRYVYEEILLVCHELDSGISEASAYAHFGARCRSRQYTKFCSLLSQNLKKGNAALLTALQEEAESAMDERKNTARQLGEEAGTKLLFPMILMLVITMVMILIPAFSSFSF